MKSQDSALSFDHLIENSSKQSQMRYEVDNPNPYSLQDHGTKFLQVKILEILYNEQVCNLVYMQDFTGIFRENERKQQQENIILANMYTNRKI